MKRFSGPGKIFKILTCVAGIILAVGYFGHVRAQSGGLAGQQMVIPLRPLAPLSTVPVPEVFGMEGILADKTAAIQLGKALFWDMQAGSDDLQACASCHFNAGADSRPTNQVNPGQAGGDNTFQMGNPSGPNYHLKAGSASAGFGGYHDGDFPFRKVSNVNDRFSVVSDVNDVAGSQGVFLSQFGSVTVPAAPPSPNPVDGGVAEIIGNDDGTSGDDAGFTRGGDGSSGRGSGRIRPSSGGHSVPSVQGSQNTVSTSAVEANTSVPDTVFSYPDPADPSKVINTRRVTGRNAPSVVDAAYNFRNFWDGRAQNVCNGVNPFGARDKKPHLLATDPINNKLGTAVVNMKNSALCSQALGPILNGTEMSADGRHFHDVGRKLLARVPLAKQMVDPSDGVLGAFSNAPKPGLNTSYMALVQKAFQPEWWQYKDNVCVAADGAAVESNKSCPAGSQPYSQMEYNFSLFWGVAIQMYESTLIADQTPFDKFMAQQQTYTLVGDDKTQSYTIQLAPGVQPYSVSIIALNPLADFTDQETYAFDYGDGRVTGVGLDIGNIDYASGQLTVLFAVPPSSGFPIKIGYSVGATPMTTAQMRGLLLFQTKGRCVNCHGGPELSNASVGTVSTVGPSERMLMPDMKVRVYDTGYYHIGVRPTAEDGGLAGSDPVAGMPLSQSEFMRQRVCSDPTESYMIPGRPGDGISMAPLNCNDDVARGGFFKAPQLRNVALTAPYFHNGSQLTLEQVVEYYNRGGDFNTFGEEMQYMDADIDLLGLTLQDKTDLVDFLRNALTDQRTVTQAAPFDHPQLLLPNGHPQGAHSYPVQNDPAHPGQATNQFIEVPAVGQNGGKPLPTFLENLLGGH
jgi:cytochrome c peroxidase